MCWGDHLKNTAGVLVVWANSRSIRHAGTSLCHRMVPKVNTHNACPIGRTILVAVCCQLLQIVVGSVPIVTGREFIALEPLMRVLISDDSPVSRQLLTRSLESHGYEVVVTCDGQTAWDALIADNPPQLAILDWHMPGLEGPEICRKLRARTDGNYCFVILLTSDHQQSSVIQGLEAGADDFLTKPFNDAELDQRLRAGRRIIELEDRLLATQEELMIQATHDALTGTWNRSAILDTLERESDRLARTGESLALMMVDVDHFKSVNDTHGHLAGDEVLKQVVERLKISLRNYDSVGRYGGEEFLVILPSTSESGVAAIGERVRSSIASTPFECATGQLNVTISVGGVVAEGEELLVPQTLIRLADESMYAAKTAGRNKVVLASHQELVESVQADVDAQTSNESPWESAAASDDKSGKLELHPALG